MKKYRNILFDLDRTLWDFDTNSTETLLEIVDKFSLEIPSSDIKDFINEFNRINEGLWGDYKRGHIKKPDLRKERFRRLLHPYGINNMLLIDKINRFYLNTCPVKSALIPDTKEILGYLSKDYRLYVLSNGFYDVQLTKMINSGISRYFLKLFTSDRIGFAKPKVQMFDYVIRSENARKDETLMIGDDENNDIMGARNAQIDQVLFNPDKIVPSVVPTYNISDLLELKKIL
jgi:YjjG family noncanonical pyrimidine nucleotidase